VAGAYHILSPRKPVASRSHSLMTYAKICENISSGLDILTKRPIAMYSININCLRGGRYIFQGCKNAGKEGNATLRILSQRHSVKRVLSTMTLSDMQAQAQKAL